MTEQKQTWRAVLTISTDRGMSPNHPNQKYESPLVSSLPPRKIGGLRGGRVGVGGRGKRREKEREARERSGYESAVHLPGAWVGQMEGTWEEAHMNHLGKQFRFCCPCNRIDLGISRPQHLALKYYSVWEALSLMTHLDLDLLRLMCHPYSIASMPLPQQDTPQSFNLVPVASLPIWTENTLKSEFPG